jgi:hypothetical protein
VFERFKARGAVLTVLELPWAFLRPWDRMRSSWGGVDKPSMVDVNWYKTTR